MIRVNSFVCGGVLGGFVGVASGCATGLLHSSSCRVRNDGCGNNVWASGCVTGLLHSSSCRVRNDERGKRVWQADVLLDCFTRHLAEFAMTGRATGLLYCFFAEASDGKEKSPSPQKKALIQKRIRALLMNLKLY